MSRMLEEFMAAGAAYPVLYRQLDALIEAAATVPAPPRAAGEPLRLLFVGYAGGGNTGADIRVAEMIRQVRAIFGRDRLEIGLVVSGEALPADLQDEVTLEVVLDYFPEFIARTIARYHGVIACDGSMFKSNLCCMLSAMMGGALGMAAVSGRLAVGYGAEAGRMEPELTEFIAGLGERPLILCRNEESRAVLEPLGLRVDGGADTAWTYRAEPAAETLRRRAALGVASGPLLVVCPMNPFWWPVRPDLAKAMALEARGEHRELHFGSVLFHPDDASIRQRYHAYLDALAGAADAWQDRHGGSVLVLGMDRVDRLACDELAGRLARRPGVIASGDAPPAALVGLLRAADLLVSSRFHAIVASMEAGVPAIGVTMDERIANLLGHGKAGRRLLRVDAPNLAGQLREAMQRAEADRVAIGQQARGAVVDHLRAMAAMGRRFAEEVRRFHPDLAVPADDADWTAWLPPLSEVQRELVARYG